VPSPPRLGRLTPHAAAKSRAPVSHSIR
jgi:hypothetical protein